MAVVEEAEKDSLIPPPPRRKRSFRPHYPAWLTAPSFVYYAIFFLGPMAILVAFSLATQRGFGSLSYGFDISQFRLVGSSLYVTIFVRTLVMASIGSLLTIAVGYPLAYWMARYLTTYKLLALLLLIVPFWTSFLIRTYALKIILSQGWNGDVRRIVQARKKQGDITPIIPTEMSEIWADNWCIPSSAPHPVAAHAWVNWLLTPSTAVTEMNYHNYKIPMAAALAQLPPALRDDPMFNVPKSYTNNYHYILNVSPQVVEARTQIYSEFKAA